MKKCPHCGQSVYGAGPRCPLCRQDMGRAAGFPQSVGEARNPAAPTPSPDDLTALERFWGERTDEALEEAAHNLVDYTETGQRVIREELQRRSIPGTGLGSQKDESGEFFEGGGVPIHTNPDFLHVGALQTAVKSHGIACEIRRSRPSPLSNRPWAELWILDASETQQARHIVQAALDSHREGGIDRGPEADDEPPQVSPSWTWTCPQCSEDVETQFSECWNCGSERPDQQPLE